MKTQNLFVALVLGLFFSPELSSAPGDDLVRCALVISSASGEEELDEEFLERLEKLEQRPLNLNTATVRQLEASCLMTHYQAVSLRDYIARCGSVRSYEELALVDGFNETLAQCLKRFTTLGLEADSAGGPQDRLSGKIQLKAGVRGDGKYSDSQRLSLDWGSRGSLFWTRSKSFSAKSEPFPGTISLRYSPRRVSGLKVIAGHYSARYALGLNSWSGMRISSLSAVSSLFPSSSGLSETSSSAASLCGVALEWERGPLAIGASCSPLSKDFTLHAEVLSRRSTLGLTITDKGSSLDWRICLKSFSILGEASFLYPSLLGSDAQLYKGGGAGSFNAAVSLLWVPSYGKNFAFQARYIHPDSKLQTFKYSGVSAIFQSNMVQAGLECNYDQALGSLNAEALGGLNLEGESSELKLRARLKHKSSEAPSRPYLNLRAEGALKPGAFELRSRLEGVLKKGLGGLGYIEGSWKGDKAAVYLRLGAFCIDSWDDRIYVYERNAPPSFSVVAYYLRGWNSSVYAVYDFNWHHKLYFRLETRQYPWSRVNKEAFWALNVQYRWVF